MEIAVYRYLLLPSATYLLCTRYLTLRPASW